MPDDVSVNSLVTISPDENSPLTRSIINECPICFENIEENDPHLILDCCFKTIHIKCLIDWYTKNPINKSCFICNQSNSFCKDFISEPQHIQTQQQSREHIIQIRRTNIDIINSTKYNIFYAIIMSFVIFIVIVVLIIINE
jgi:hypothetical protein